MSIYLAASMTDDGCIQLHQMVSLSSILKTVRINRQPILCIWNNPRSIETIEDLCKEFKGKRVGDRKFRINNEDIYTLYRHWRRAYYMGNVCSEVFNLEGSDLPNRLVPARNHLPFDIRLGFLVTLDQRILRLLGRITAVAEEKIFNL